MRWPLPPVGWVAVIATAGAVCGCAAHQPSNPTGMGSLVRGADGPGGVAWPMAECGMALAIDPAFAAARNNLGLIHAAAGRWTEAAEAFRVAAGDEAVGQYNLGVAYASRGEHGLAADAFEAAATLRPAFDQARQRARQARRMAEGQGPPDRKR